jgi:hypothetical protein
MCGSMNSRLIIVVVLLVVIGIGAYVWWQGSPLRSLEQAGIAVKTHNIAQFHEFVDERTLLQGFLDDLVFNPVIETPGLTKIQQQVGHEAASAMREPLFQSLQRQLTAYVEGTAVAAPIADNVEQSSIPSSAIQPERITFRDVLQAAKSEIRSEASRLKHVAHMNMENYAAQHSDQLVCQLISSKKGERKSIIRDRLHQYGLDAHNFRGIAFVRDIETASEEPRQCIIGLKFNSPKLNHEITTEVKLVQQSAFGSWKITRFVNLRPLVSELEPSYDSDIHNLTLATVSGVTPQAVKHEVMQTTSRILQAPETKTFFKNLKNKARRWGLLE